MEEYVTDACVRGFHIYQDVWRPVMGEELPCETEEDNDKDRYAVAIIKPTVGTVGHVPRYMSRLCYHFIQHGGEIYSIVTGTRQYSRDLPNGGMHIPCKFRFVGSSEEIKKISSYMKNNPAKKLLSHSNVSCRGHKVLEVKPIGSNKEVKKELLSENDPDIAAGTSKLSSNSTIQTCSGRSPLIDSPGGTHSRDNSYTKTTALKPATAVSVEAKVKRCQPGISGMSIVEKVFSVNDDGSCSDSDDNDSVWVRCAKCVLNAEDKMTVEIGDELTDKHIQMAQYLLKCQFPLVGGLNNTLKQRQLVIGCTANTIQIIHCSRRKHWITVSTKGCPAGEVNVYDTIFNKLDYETRDTIKKMFSIKNCNRINIVPVQKQSGSKDCGVFAIAIMTSIAYGEDPQNITYDQDRLRAHLLDCFTSKSMRVFPQC